MPAIAPAIQSLTNAATSLSGVATLGGVIAFHEAGHFLAARSQGITVQDFSIGFGPKILSYEDKDGINYSLRLLPLGGYVSFPEALTEEDKAEWSEEDRKDIEEKYANGELKEYSLDDPNLLQNRPVGQRALVISAGVIFNMILSFGAILAIVTTGGVLEPSLKPGVAVPQIVNSEGAGARFGFKSGDIVVKVDGVTLSADEKETSQLVQKIKSSGGKVIHFDVQRGSQMVQLDVTPDKTSKGDGIIGVKLAANIEKVVAKKPANPVEAISMTSKEFSRIFTQTVNGLARIVTNLGSSAGSLAGPVGVMQMGAEASQQGALLTFAALISINLGIMNALPLPALDGGQMVFLAYEALAGKAVDQKIVRGVNGAAISLLIAVSLGLLLSDVEKLIPASFR